MRFSIVAAAFTAFAGVTTAQLSADAICQTLDALTTQANGLVQQVNSLNLLNAPLALIGQGPLPGVISGLAQIVSNVTTCLQDLQPQQLVGDAATDIVTSFSQFAQAQTQLLNSLTAQAAMCLNLPSLLSPVAALLGGLDGSLNALVTNLIDCLDDITGGAVQSDLNLVDAALAQALNRYS